MSPETDLLEPAEGCYLEIVTLQRSSGHSEVIGSHQGDWCPYEKGNLDMDTQEEATSGLEWCSHEPRPAHPPLAPRREHGPGTLVPTSSLKTARQGCLLSEPPQETGTGRHLELMWRPEQPSDSSQQGSPGRALSLQSCLPGSLKPSESHSRQIPLPPSTTHARSLLGQLQAGATRKMGAVPAQPSLYLCPKPPPQAWPQAVLCW